MISAMANRTPAKIICDDQSAESIPNFSYPILTPEKVLLHNTEQMNANRITEKTLVKIFSSYLISVSVAEPLLTYHITP